MANIEDISSIESSQYYPIVLIPQGVKDYVKSSILTINYYPSFSNYNSELSEKQEALERETIKYFGLKKPIEPNKPKHPNAPIKPEHEVTLSSEAVYKRRNRYENFGCFMILVSSFFYMMLLEFIYSKFIEISGIEGGVFFFGILLFGGFFLIFKKLSRFEWGLKATRTLTKKELKEANHDYQLKASEYAIECLDYEERIKKFHYDQSTYLKALSVFNNDLKSKTQLFVKRKYLDYLKPQSHPSRLEGQTLKGRTEINFLENHLLPTFHDKIKINMGLGYRSPFIPDFVFDDGDLCIDIEIDEPYDVSERKPIHYIGSDDDKRNTFFLDKNWFVLRFAEEQIIKYPEKCVAAIKLLVKTIKELNTSHYNSVSLQRIKRWTYEEAFLMAKNNSRN